ncbi:MAG TPA: hypothetical protein V6C72_07195, partial [Chroococcales cyanobacterium]
HTGRIDAAKKMVPVLAQIKNAVGRGEYVKRWAMKLGVREDQLEFDVGQYTRQHRPAGQFPQRAPRLPEKRHAAQALRSGVHEAEQGILAVYLLTRDDYDRAAEAFSDWSLISPEHSRIKEAIEGVGSQFNTVEDLQYKVMDRLGPEKDLSAAFVEIVLKVEEMRKQNAPIDKLIFEFKARLLKEKLTRALARVRQLLVTSEDESTQEELQSRIKQLNQMEIVSLVSASTLEQLEELRRKIHQIEGAAT